MLLLNRDCWAEESRCRLGLWQEGAGNRQGRKNRDSVICIVSELQQP